jgi:hypothetical protein
MQTRVFILIALCLFPFVSPAQAPAKPAAPSAEESGSLKWAREIAESYLKAGIYAPGSDAWTSAEFKKRLAAAAAPPLTYTYKVWTITDGVAAPDASEIIFKGTVNATSRITFYGTGGSSTTAFEGSVSFTLRVAKEDGGRWRVDAVQFDPPAK